MTTYVTVAIPYVNAAPHLGYSYELVEADIYARALRRAGESVRFLGGTDDHSLKNVLAAEAAGRPDRRVRRRQRPALRAPGGATRAVVRRLHPHQHGPAPPAGRRALVASLRGEQ